MRTALDSIYKKLYSYFGPQHWWPAESPFEVMAGAILTQNTNWSNVEKAINNLKEKKLLQPLKLYRLPKARLARLIKPAGYYNIKAGRLKEFLKFFFKFYQGNIGSMSSYDTYALREQLLCVKGIGEETADSILLYALGKPIFVVDAYTRRILSRHKLAKEDFRYTQMQNLFMRNLENDVKLFNEFHALLVKLGKEFCLKRRPKCEGCPLKKSKVKSQKSKPKFKIQNF
jgi:endonuclease-3 related protein